MVFRGWDDEYGWTKWSTTGFCFTAIMVLKVVRFSLRAGNDEISVRKQRNKCNLSLYVEKGEWPEEKGVDIDE
ncbi:hypothetical protein ACNGM1_23060 [Escherichia coli]